MKHKILFISGIFLSTTILFLFTLCCSMPLKKPAISGLTENCRMFLECMYYNQENTDKSICSTFATGCKGANDFIMCSQSEKMDVRDCLLTLKK